MDAGWPRRESPFHAGERHIQQRLGVRDRVERVARRIIRDHLTERDRAFYARLPFLLLGTVDAGGRPWASIVPGRRGFVASPDPQRLEIAARPLIGDPLHDTLEAGAHAGLLGIDPETRRRNRISGRIESVRPDGFAVTVEQAFGNCPKYIQTRSVDVLPEIGETAPPRPIRRSRGLDARTRNLVERSDTFFIATAYAEDRGAVSQGADVSHRGGKPGFVRAEDERRLVFPDFAGNNHFNTLGNILLDPRTGLLFVDFETGSLVYMTGESEILWDGAEVRAFAGAERLVRFRTAEVIRVEGSLPLRFDLREYSPALDPTGTWAPAASPAHQVNGRTNQMFIVLLRFSGGKGQAGQFMEGHKEWIDRGFADGVFLLAGSLQPHLGGGIVAHNTSLSDLQGRVNDDPFVAENVVTAEILEIAPSRADERLNFLSAG